MGETPSHFSLTLEPCEKTLKTTADTSQLYPTSFHLCAQNLPRCAGNGTLRGSMICQWIIPLRRNFHSRRFGGYVGEVVDVKLLSGWSKVWAGGEKGMMCVFKMTF